MIQIKPFSCVTFSFAKYLAHSQQTRDCEAAKTENDDNN